MVRVRVVVVSVRDRVAVVRVRVVVVRVRVRGGKKRLKRSMPVKHASPLDVSE